MQTNSFKDIFQKFFWTLEAAVCRCSASVLLNSFFKEHLRVAAFMDFSEVSGWLLLKTSLSQVFFRRIINFSNKHPRFVYIALLNFNYVKERVTVNKINTAGERLI